ncbi:extensin-like [Sitophilus oryzae]|uniref:Extensin-like n=1 Tax=Sitophilus oryzae TaxID=7048 RepID=A0A6J2Y5A7_SITOR|nr:extensin-like [Sitophilus oryzae]
MPPIMQHPPQSYPVPSTQTPSSYYGPSGSTTNLAPRTYAQQTLPPLNCQLPVFAPPDHPTPACVPPPAPNCQLPVYAPSDYPTLACVPPPAPIKGQLPAPTIDVPAYSEVPPPVVVLEELPGLAPEEVEMIFRVWDEADAREPPIPATGSAQSGTMPVVVSEELPVLDPEEVEMLFRVCNEADAREPPIPATDSAQSGTKPGVVRRPSSCRYHPYNGSYQSYQQPGVCSSYRTMPPIMQHPPQRSLEGKLLIRIGLAGAGKDERIAYFDYEDSDARGDTNPATGNESKPSSRYNAEIDTRDVCEGTTTAMTEHE